MLEEPAALVVRAPGLLLVGAGWQMMVSADITVWFPANKAFFREMDEAAKGFLVLIAGRNWTAPKIDAN